MMEWWDKTKEYWKNGRVEEWKNLVMGCELRVTSCELTPYDLREKKVIER